MVQIQRDIELGKPVIGYIPGQNALMLQVMAEGEANLAALDAEIVATQEKITKITTEYEAIQPAVID